MAGLIAPVARLIDEFSKLPGVGQKTAQRLTYHMLRAPADEARGLAAALVAVKEQVAYCSVCCNITEAGVDPCAICSFRGFRLADFHVDFGIVPPVAVE